MILLIIKKYNTLEIWLNDEIMFLIKTDALGLRTKCLMLNWYLRASIDHPELNPTYPCYLPIKASRQTLWKV